MSGLLEKKSRILDTFITTEGRRQASTGKMKVEYVSFSDAGAIYALDTLISGGLDFTSRLTFEAGNLPQDSITFEADDSGKLLANFISADAGYNVVAGQIYSGSNTEHVTGSQFASLSAKLLSSTLDSFKKLSILGSPDPLNLNYNDFIVYPEIVEFNITKTKPISNSEMQTIDIDKVESLFYDKRLSHIPNFKFLPPVNKPRTGNMASATLGDYANINQSPILQFSDLQRELNEIDRMGFKKTIQILKSSVQTNLFGQFFEISDDVVKKLDVIDFGDFPPDNKGIVRHVFFVGKIMTDGSNTTTFVNLFTLVFS
jgi:hypothetical protein